MIPISASPTVSNFITGKTLSVNGWQHIKWLIYKEKVNNMDNRERNQPGGWSNRIRSERQEPCFEFTEYLDRNRFIHKKGKKKEIIVPENDPLNLIRGFEENYTTPGGAATGFRSLLLNAFINAAISSCRVRVYGYILENMPCGAFRESQEDLIKVQELIARGSLADGETQVVVYSRSGEKMFKIQLEEFEGRAIEQPRGPQPGQPDF